MFIQPISHIVTVSNSVDNKPKNNVFNVPFGYRHYLKTLFKQGLLPTVKKDIYGSDLTKDTVSLEHLIPHSKGGSSSLKNYALATVKNNNLRGTEGLDTFVSEKQAKEYLDQFKDVKVPYQDKGGTHIFEGNKYIDMIKNTLSLFGIKV